MNSFLNMDQKKGDPREPHGKLTVYARVTGDSSGNSQLSDLLRGGFLVAQGNYRDQSSLRDFLQQELGTSFDDEEGIKSFVENLGGIEGALDPEKFKEKLEELEDMEEFIPTPAKMVFFDSEAAILNEEGDVFYLGEYENNANANLAVNAVTILYQAKYREFQILKVRSEVDSMLTQLDIPFDSGLSATYYEKILHDYIPQMIHAKQDRDELDRIKDELYSYVAWYSPKSDLDRLIFLVTHLENRPKLYKLIELYVKKIEALSHEDFDNLSSIVSDIKSMEEEVGDL